VFIEAKDDGGGGDSWTNGAISRAKLQSNHCNVEKLRATYPDRIDAKAETHRRAPFLTKLHTDIGEDVTEQCQQQYYCLEANT